MSITEIEAGLQAFVASELGADFELAGVEESDGHAGLTFLFEVRGAADADTTGYVLKVPPKGVRRKGNTDVYRQAPLLRTLHRLGLPVPKVPWAYEDNPWFEIPFIIMERLPGRVFFVWDPPPSFSREREASRALWRQCIELLPRVHALDWRQELKDWEAPEALDANINRWQRIYERAMVPEWITSAARVQQLLIDTQPDGTPVGLFHGDYQPGNLLYENGRCTGIIDWELSGIGPTLLDVGWLMLVGDEAIWDAQWHPIHAPSPAEIRDLYEAQIGRQFEDIPWYQAFAGYRLGSIGCLNLKLHRSGQRQDPMWEHMGRAVPRMFARAEEILIAMR